MLGTAAIRNLIRENKIAQMYSSIQTGNSLGMQTLDQNLTDLVRRNVITPAEARAKAKIPRELPRLMPDRQRPHPARAQRKRTLMERDQASKFINDLLRADGQRATARDLFLTADFPPAIKVDGKVTKVSPQPLTGQHTLALARAVMNDKQAAEFERTKECNFAISPQGIGRFRVNAFMQQGHVGLVLRTIPQTLPTIDGLGLPQVLKDVAMTKRGLVHLRRRHRLGQEHLAGGDGRLPQRELATATSSRSRTRWSSCTRTRTASSRSARSASTPTAGKRR